jgi:nitrogen fixation NifU-like protein
VPRPAYSATLLDHFKRPRNFGPLEGATAVHEDLNPLCGDRIRMEARVVEGRVSALRFRGDACAICVASASLLTGMAEGLGVQEAEALDVPALIAALESEIEPGRVQCVQLPVTVLRGALASVR